MKFRAPSFAALQATATVVQELPRRRPRRDRGLARPRHGGRRPVSAPSTAPCGRSRSSTRTGARRCSTALRLAQERARGLAAAGGAARGRGSARRHACLLPLDRVLLRHAPPEPGRAAHGRGLHEPLLRPRRRAGGRGRLRARARDRAGETTEDGAFTLAHDRVRRRLRLGARGRRRPPLPRAASLRRTCPRSSRRSVAAPELAHRRDGGPRPHASSTGTSRSAATRRSRRPARWSRRRSSTRSRRRTCAGAAAPVSRRAARRRSLAKDSWRSRIYLVVNADESEPGAFKDRDVMRSRPHRLIEGCLITAYAIESQSVFIYMRGEYLHEFEVHALGARRGAARRDLLGGVTIVLHRGAGAYICGEETALLESLEGKRGQPRPRPPFPPVHGLYDAPTQINNVEHDRDSCPRSSSSAPRSSRRSACRTAPGTARLLALRERREPRELRACARDDDARADLRRRRRGRGRSRAEGGHPRRLVGPVLTPDQIDTPMDYDSIAAAGSFFGSAGDHRRRRPLLHGAARAPRGAVLHARVVRQVHAVPRRDPLARPAPRRRSRTATRRSADLDAARSVCDRMLGKSPLRARRLRASIPSPATSTSTATSSRRTSTPGAARSRELLDRGHRRPSPAHAPPGPRCRVSRKSCRLVVSVRRARLGHRRRPRRSRCRRAPASSRRRGRRDRDPGLLLRAAARAAGRRLPHVPRRDRGHAEAAGRLHADRAGRDGRPHGARRRRRRPRARRRRSSSSSSTTRSTARSATRAASARCRTSPSATGPGRTRMTFSKRDVRQADPDLAAHRARPRALHPLLPLHPLLEDVAEDGLLDRAQPRRATEIATFEDEPYRSPFSGNVIELCPVGALTSTLYRFEGRPWEIQNVPTVCTGCPVGLQRLGDDPRGQGQADPLAATIRRSTAAGSATRGASRTRTCARRTASRRRCAAAPKGSRRSPGTTALDRAEELLRERRRLDRHRALRLGDDGARVRARDACCARASTRTRPCCRRRPRPRSTRSGCRSRAIARRRARRGRRRRPGRRARADRRPLDQGGAHAAAPRSSSARPPATCRPSPAAARRCAHELAEPRQQARRSGCARPSGPCSSGRAPAAAAAPASPSSRTRSASRTSPAAAPSTFPRRRTGAASPPPGRPRPTRTRRTRSRSSCSIVSGDEAAADPSVRALAEQAEAVIAITMFQDLAAGWADLILPATASLERDGTTMNLEGRAAAAAPRGRCRPCPDELAWLSQARRPLRGRALARMRRASSRSSPNASSATSRSRASGSTPRCPAARAVRAARPATTPPRAAADASDEHFIGELRLHRYRPLFSGPPSSASPSSQFQRPERRGRALAADAERRGIASRRRGPRPLERHVGRAPRPHRPKPRRGRRARRRRARRRPARERRGGEGRDCQPPEWWVSLDPGVRDHQPRHGHVRLPDARRAQGDGADAAALRPEPRRPVRAPAADRRPGQAAAQGELLPGRRGRLALPARAVPRRLHGADDVLGDPVRPRLGDRRRLHPRPRRRRRHRADPDLRDRLARDLRVHRRRLGVGLEVRAARLDAHLRAARLVRGLARPLRARRRDHGRVALARRHRRGAGATRSGTWSRSSSGSSSSSSPAPPRLRARRSTCPRPSRSSSPATTPSTAGCASGSSRCPSTST